MDDITKSLEYIKLAKEHAGLAIGKGSIQYRSVWDALGFLEESLGARIQHEIDKSIIYQYQDRSEDADNANP